MDAGPTDLQEAASVGIEVWPQDLFRHVSAGLAKDPATRAGVQLGMGGHGE